MPSCWVARLRMHPAYGDNSRTSLRIQSTIFSGLAAAAESGFFFLKYHSLDPDREKEQSPS